MIVCICQGLSGHEIQRVIDDGHGTVREIGAACGAGLPCGACRETLQKMLYSEKQPTDPETAPGVGVATKRAPS